MERIYDTILGEALDAAYSLRYDKVRCVPGHFLGRTRRILFDLCSPKESIAYCPSRQTRITDPSCSHQPGSQPVDWRAELTVIPIFEKSIFRRTQMISPYVSRIGDYLGVGFSQLDPISNPDPSAIRAPETNSAVSNKSNGCHCGWFLSHQPENSLKKVGIEAALAHQSTGAVAVGRKQSESNPTFYTLLVRE